MGVCVVCDFKEVRAQNLFTLPQTNLHKPPFDGGAHTVLYILMNCEISSQGRYVHIITTVAT